MTETPQNIAYQESVRAITMQASVLDGLRTRAGTILAAASLVTSFLGGQALAKPSISGGVEIQANIGVWGWVAIAAFAGVALLALAILFPYTWKFEQSARAIIGIVETTPEPVTAEDAERELALRHEINFDSNRLKLDRLFWCFGAACGLIAIEAVAWVVDLRS